MTELQTWIPLFPLKTVLFPDGVLPLKVFEAHYIDMVRRCVEDRTPLGIALIRTGPETAANDPEEIGCLAHIDHADTEASGAMALRMRGGKRFRILETRALDDRRTEARIEMIPADAQIAISAMHVSCAKALKTVMDGIAAKSRASQGTGAEAPFALPLQFDNAAWVANRWCEILPIPLKARQKLLELGSAQNRLSIVHQYLQQHKIL